MPEWVDTQKQANQHRDQRMMEVNQINNAIRTAGVGDASPISLESLVKANLGKRTEALKGIQL
jgi:hypothetical protein